MDKRKGVMLDAQRKLISSYFQTKERLISLVLVQDKSVVSAAKRCKIKESTAKMAIKAYKDKLKKNSNQNLIRNVKTGSRS